MDEQPCRLGLRLALGERVGHRLVLGQRLAERLAGERVIGDEVKRRPIHSDRKRPDARAEQVERAHRHSEAGSGLAEDLLRANVDAVKLQRAPGTRFPEDRRLERSRLARRLRFLGFGSVQNSLWVSPHDHSGDVAGLLAELDESDHATLFTAQPDTVVGLSALVSRAWDLSGLVDRYDAFDAEFSPLRRRRALAALSDREAFLTRTRLVHQFRGFPVIDPELPESVAAVSSPRQRAAATFHELYEGLALAS